MNTIEAVIVSISAEFTVQRIEKDPLKKVVLKLKAEENQTFYVDVLNSKIDKLKNFKVGDKIKLDYTFVGSESVKTGMKHNNLYMKDIQKLK